MTLVSVGILLLSENNVLSHKTEIETLTEDQELTDHQNLKARVDIDEIKEREKQDEETVYLGEAKGSGYRNETEEQVEAITDQEDTETLTLNQEDNQTTLIHLSSIKEEDTTDSELNKETVQNKTTEKTEESSHSTTDSLVNSAKEKPVEKLTEKSIEKSKDSPALPFNGQSTLPITNYLLPLSHSTDRVEKLTHILLHFSSNAANNPSNPYVIDDVYSLFNDYGVSAHYVIDRQGTVYRMVDENRVAYHAGKGSLANFPEYTDKLNHHSIGIELLAIGTQEEMVPIIGDALYQQIDASLIGYTDQQYVTLNRLVTDIVARHPEIKRTKKHILGHDEYAPGRKTDPGSLFKWANIGL